MNQELFYICTYDCQTHTPTQNSLSDIFIIWVDVDTWWWVQWNSCCDYRNLNKFGIINLYVAIWVEIRDHDQPLRVLITYRLSIMITLWPYLLNCFTLHYLCENHILLKFVNLTSLPYINSSTPLVIACTCLVSTAKTQKKKIDYRSDRVCVG